MFVTHSLCYIAYAIFTLFVVLSMLYIWLNSLKK